MRKSIGGPCLGVASAPLFDSNGNSRCMWRMAETFAHKEKGNEETSPSSFCTLLRRLAEAHERELHQRLADVKAENARLRESLSAVAQLHVFGGEGSGSRVSFKATPDTLVIPGRAAERTPLAPAHEPALLQFVVPGCVHKPYEEDTEEHEKSDDEERAERAEENKKATKPNEERLQRRHEGQRLGQEQVVVCDKNYSCTLRVRILGAHGLCGRNCAQQQDVAPMSPYCVCHVQRRSKEEFRTQAASGSCTDPIWDHHIEVPDFAGDDELIFKVFDGKHGSNPGDLLGLAKLTGSSISEEGYEGSVALRGGADDAHLLINASRAASSEACATNSSTAKEATAMSEALSGGELLSGSHEISAGSSKRRSTMTEMSRCEPFPTRHVWLSECAVRVRASRSFTSVCASSISEEALTRQESHGLMQRCISFPASPYRLVWDITGAVLILYDSLVIPLQVFNPPETEFSRGMDVFALIFWTLNIVASVLVGYVQNGVTEMRPAMVVRHYATTWFMPDLLVVLPDWVFTMQSIGSSKTGSESSVKLLRIARLMRTVRLIRLLKLRWILATLSDLLSSEYSSIYANIAMKIMMLCIINHFISCTYYLIANVQYGKNDTWIDNLVLADASWAYKYLTAFHWSMTQFTPAAMQLEPRNTVERGFAIAVVVAALVGFSYLVGSITNSQSQLRSMTEDASKQFWILRRYLKHHHVPRVLNCRIQRYLEHAWQKQKASVSEPTLCSLLSEQLSNELKSARSLPHMLMHPLFDCLHKNSNVSLQRLAVSAISWSNLARADSLFFPGEIATHLYFVVEGRLHYAKLDGCGTETYEWVDQPGNWIAEPALWTAMWVHLGTLTAVSESSLVVVDGASFANIICLNPAVFHLVRGYARRFMDWLNSVPRADLSDVLQGEDVMPTLKQYIEDTISTERTFTKKNLAVARKRLSHEVL